VTGECRYPRGDDPEPERDREGDRGEDGHLAWQVTERSAAGAMHEGQSASTSGRPRRLAPSPGPVRPGVPGQGQPGRPGSRSPRRVSDGSIDTGLQTIFGRQVMPLMLAPPAGSPAPRLPAGQAP